MLEKIKKLIDVKSLTTLTFNIIFFMLCMKGKIESENFISIYMMILAFYFGTQANKNKEDKKEE